MSHHHSHMLPFDGTSWHPNLPVALELPAAQLPAAQLHGGRHRRHSSSPRATEARVTIIKSRSEAVNTKPTHRFVPAVQEQQVLEGFESWHLCLGQGLGNKKLLICPDQFSLHAFLVAN